MRPCRAGLRLVLVGLAVAAAALVAGCPQPAGRASSPARECPRYPPRAEQIWKADLEEGTLADWSAPPEMAGGGEFNSGSGYAAASTEHAHSGAWGTELVLPDGRGGTRLFRWRELRAHRRSLVSVWLLIPRAYALTGDRATGRFWNLFQFKSRSPEGRNDPLWFVNLARPAAGRLRLQLVWWHRTLEGPRPGRHGFRRFRQRIKDVPVGRWFKLTALLRQSNRFDGKLCVWQGRRRLFAKEGVRTSFANCAYNRWCTSNEWSVNNYSDGLDPRPAVVYVDDARIGGW
jgi:hypothetical protein